jgi:predicted nucleotidyltransferase
LLVKVDPQPGLEARLRQARADFLGETLAVMLYGSHARGDATPESDIDLLQLVPHSPNSYRNGVVTVVAYTPDQLREMATSGGLFAWHLRSEGRVLEDPDGLLVGALAGHRGPACDATLTRLRELSAVLDMDEAEFERYANRGIRTARYLLRTAVYARSLRTGEQSFALERAARAAGANDYVALLRRGAEGEEDWEIFLEYRSRLARLVGPLVTNPYGSLEALAVNAWNHDSHMASLAIQTMASREGEIEYATLPPPVL